MSKSGIHYIHPLYATIRQKGTKYLLGGNKMNQLMNTDIKMTSLDIAEIVGKDHKNVMRDIRNEIESLGTKTGELIFEPTSYTDKSNREKPCYEFGKDGAMQLALKYDAKTRYKVIKRIEELESGQAQQAKPSYMIDDPVKRAETWIDEQKEKQEIETKNKMLEQRVSEYEPKVTYVDEILKSTNTVTVSQIAEDYGMTGQEMNKVLHQIGIQYKTGGQWLLYSRHKGNGYTRSNTVDVTHSDGRQSVKMHTKWTQKGRLFIYESLKANNILPLMDINYKKNKQLEGVI